MYSRGMSNLRAALVIVLGILPACAASKPEPEVASSASHGGYAKEFPAELQAVTKDFALKQGEARKAMGEFAGYPGKYKDPNYKQVAEVISRADEDGRQYQYVERLRRVEAAAEFFEAEKDEINRKVAGAVAYAAKKKSCDADIAGSAVPALRDAVDKQLEKELADESEAHQLIERYKVQLGKENATELGHQADAVSRASYLVHIRLVEDKVRILRLLKEVDDVKRTAAEVVEAEHAFQAEKKVTDPEKKASQARIEEINKSQASLDAALQQAQALVPTFEDELKKIQREYDDALEGLKAKLRDKSH